LYRNEDLKAGEGNADWLRFFQLVSSEFAAFEGTAPVPYTPERAGRVQEIRSLDKKLQAVRRLETLNESFHFVERNPSLHASYFLVQFNHATKSMEVEGYDRISRVSEQYGYEEHNHMNLNTVVVEVDTIRDLKEAYPNYFLDVRLFTQNVVNALSDGPLVTSLRRQNIAKTAQGYEVGWIRDLRKYFPGMFRKED
jgi:hypothetical protein